MSNRTNQMLSANASRLNLGTRSLAALAGLDNGTQTLCVRPFHPRMHVTPTEMCLVGGYSEPLSILWFRDSSRADASSGFRYRPGLERASAEFEASRREGVAVPMVPGDSVPPSSPRVSVACSSKRPPQPGQPKPKRRPVVILPGRDRNETPAAWTRNLAPDPSALRAVGG